MREIASGLGIIIASFVVVYFLVCINILAIAPGIVAPRWEIIAARIVAGTIYSWLVLKWSYQLGKWVHRRGESK